MKDLRHDRSAGNWMPVLGLILVTPFFFWSYWPELTALVHTWQTEPDYSHGFLVAPLAIYFLWARRAGAPRELHFSWGGLVLIAASIVFRGLSHRFYLNEFAAWSIVLWIGGVIWLFGGWPLFRWSLPVVAFLFFMMKLPLRWERLFASPLRSIATAVSTFTLQCLGQPAVAEGNVIILSFGNDPTNNLRLEVAEACAGLRMGIGIVAMAFAVALLIRRAWWHKAILIALAPVVAIAANTIRITGTGLFMRVAPEGVTVQAVHDVAGWLMVPVALILFWILHWVLDHVTAEKRSTVPLRPRLVRRTTPSS